MPNLHSPICTAGFDSVLLLSGTAGWLILRSARAADDAAVGALSAASFRP